MEVPGRIEAKIERLPDLPGCWLWIGASDRLGYGRVWFEGRLQLAHRVMRKLAGSPIDDSLDADHLCRTPACVRPDHIEGVDHATNIRRGMVWAINGKKTHCPRGHTYDIVVNGGRSRWCSICRATESRERYRRTHSLSSDSFRRNT